ALPIFARVGIRDVGEAHADRLELATLPAARVLGLEQKRTEALERHLGRVPSGGGLPERHLARGAFFVLLAGAADAQRRLPAVVEAFVRREGVDADAHDGAVDLRLHVDLAAALDAHVLAHELPPEPTEVRPPEPLDGPAVLHVARPRERPAEPGAPASEHRLAAIALEDELRGRRLELRRDVAVEQRRARDRDALQEIRRGDLRDGKPLLDGRLLRDDLRLAREDARQRV